MSDEEVLHRDRMKRGAPTAIAIGASILFALAAVVWAFIAYIAGGRPLSVGLATTIVLLALSLAVMLVGRRLVAFRTMTEPRPPALPLPTLVEVDRRSSRRLLAALAAGFAGAVAMLFLPLPALAPGRRSLTRTRWAPGVRLTDASGVPLSIMRNLRPGMLIFPEGALGHMPSMAILASMGPPPVAFSKLCTHAGCAVDLDEEENHLVCPCHLSRFSTDGGARVAGPAGKALPRLPIEIDEAGDLVAGGDFDAPPGPSEG